MTKITYATDTGAVPAAVKWFACALTAAPIAASLVTPAVTAVTAEQHVYIGKTPSSNEQSGWHEIQRRLDLYSALADGWDGQHAPRVSSTVIDRARQTAAYLKQLSAPLPVMQLSTDGELDFVWDDDERSASIAFLRAGEVLLFAFDPEWEAPYKSVGRVFDTSDLDPIVEVAAHFGQA